jgi:hypothetical protein
MAWNSIMKGVNTFRGFKLTGVYRCSRDPSGVRALLKLPDGGIYWESKMSLDVDGSFAATSGRIWRDPFGKVMSSTDQCGTSLKWKVVPAGEDCKHPKAQVDPDRLPFVGIPMDGVSQITGDKAKEIGAEFATKTALVMRDMGVAILGNRWTPVFIADGGPFMRLGEGSTRVFKALSNPQEDRCRKWSQDGNRCVGPGGDAYPYRNFSQTGRVVYILYPHSGKEDLNPDNAIARICAFAKDKLGLTGSSNCP